jgi:glycosyltransferase involved in cell wall biosynthesis
VKKVFALLCLAAAAIGFWQGGFPRVVAHQQQTPSSPCRFALIVYARNAAAWIDKCLASLAEQDYPPARIIVVDDDSTDRTPDAVKAFIAQTGQEETIFLLTTEKKLGPVGALLRAADQCSREEIAVWISGKDWLASPTALTALASQPHSSAGVTAAGGISYPSYTPYSPSRWPDRRALHAFPVQALLALPRQEIWDGEKFTLSFEQLLNRLYLASPAGVLLVDLPLLIWNETRTE